MILEFAIISFLLIVCTVNVIGQSQYLTTSVTADKDSYVDSDHPDMTHGMDQTILAGISFNDTLYEIFMGFSLNNSPQGWISAEISFTLFDLVQILNISIWLIEEHWEESTLTWNNKPAQGELITSFNVTQDDTYTFDITDFVGNRNNISICVNATKTFPHEDFEVFSREFGAETVRPQLIWTYPNPNPPSSIGGYDVLIFLGIALISIFSYSLMRKHKQKSTD